MGMLELGGNGTMPNTSDSKLSCKDLAGGDMFLTVDGTGPPQTKARLLMKLEKTFTLNEVEHQEVNAVVVSTGVPIFIGLDQPVSKIW